MAANTDKIAVVGLAGRFPGAENVTEYWNNLIEGKETISVISDDDLSKYEVNYNELKDNPNYVKSRGVLKDIDKFDATFFGMTPKEASLTDPQHRIWLETAWNAFENANIDPFTYNGAIGVYAGGYINTYLLNNLLRDPLRLENFIRLRSTESFQLMTGNDVAYIPTKTSYKFNLKGPAINVQTACSTSLVAIIQACQSLFTFESDVCLAGGVCILTPQETGYLYQEGAIPSPDGHCRPFDSQARGTVFSNGIGIVVLKRLEDAFRDKDRIYAVVSGWGLNNDGNKKVSYTAPSIDGQAEVIMMAQSFADISPEDIGYIEAHGTGTQLGDPIEIAALTKAFSRKTNKKQFCGIGSVKSNIGHTDAAAGVASFIKASLSAYNRIIPKTLNYNQPNPHIDFANSPFYVQSDLKVWKEEKPLIIGVSSFGIGGTNAHVVIEEPPRIINSLNENEKWPYIIPVSAKSEKALESRKEQIAEILKDDSLNLSDVAYTLQSGRNHMPFRSFTVSEPINKLAKNQIIFSDGKAIDAHKSLTFVFPGQGAQYINMGKDLYNNVKEFKDIADQCFKIFKDTTGTDLRSVLYPESMDPITETMLSQTQYTQPALFILEYGLANVFQNLGISPNYLIGHSIGEYAAAACSGVFDLESAFRIVIKRGQLMQSMPPGQMLAVRCNLEELQKLQSTLFEIAAENSRTACTISLEFKNAEAVKELLTQNNINFVLLNTSHAFHSSAFDPILEEFEKYVDSFSPGIPEIPFVSCLTGNFITNEEAQSGKYWSKQLRNTVLFDKGVSNIAALGEGLFMEVGPNTHLSSFIKTNKQVTNKTGVIFSLGKPEPETTDKTKIIQAIGNLWTQGYPIDFNSIYSHNTSNKITLPDYPFEKNRHWIEYLPDKSISGSNQISLEIEPEHNEKDNTQSGLIASLKQMLSDLSGFSTTELKENVRFSDIGFDSLFLAQFARSLEKQYQTPILFRQIAHEYPTIEQLANYLSSLNIFVAAEEKKVLSPVTNSLNNLTIVSTTGNGIPLVLVHCGNGVNFIPAHFSQIRPVYSFFDIGSDGENIDFENIDQMAANYVDQLLSVDNQGPFIIAGFSFGGLLTFKMAEILTKRNISVPGLILVDSSNPTMRDPFRRHRTLLKNRNNIISFSYNFFRKRVIARVVTFYCNLFNRKIPISFRRHYIRNVYAKLTRSFRPEKYNSDMLLFKAIESTYNDKYLGWKDWVKSIDTIMVYGDHETLLRKEENKEIYINGFLKFTNSIDPK